MTLSHRSPLRPRSAIVLAGLLVVATATTASIEAVGYAERAASCSGNATIGDPDVTCDFDCLPNQDITVGGAGAVFISIAGSCGGATAGCYDSNLAPTSCPQDSPHPGSSSGRGTCTAFGAGTFTFSAP